MPSSEAGRPCAVLVVEDDAILRLHALDIVEEAGFTAIEAKNADEAITILENRSDIVLLFTDVNMPGSMDGLGLAHHTRRHWPWIGLMLASGLKRPEAADMPHGSRFLAKPYSPSHLVQGVRELVAAV